GDERAQRRERGSGVAVSSSRAVGCTTNSAHRGRHRPSARGGGGSLSSGRAAAGDESRPSGPDRGGLHPVGGGAARISGRALAPAAAPRSPAAGGQHGGASPRRAGQALANVTNPFRGAQAAVTTGRRRSIVIDRWHL